MGDVGVFITEKMRSIAVDQNFDFAGWERLFKDTFDELNNSLSEESFKRYNVEKQKFSGGFLLSQYEVVSYGVGYNLAQGAKLADINKQSANMWSDERYTNWSGSGITATRRLPKIVPFGREVFNGN